MERTIDELEEYSFLPITNDFNQLSFGGFDREMYGTTTPEIINAALLGLCEYIKIKTQRLVVKQTALRDFNRRSC